MACLVGAPPALGADGQGRIALVMGNNRGVHSRQELRFAESDAIRLAEVLVELGDFPRSDVYLLRGASIPRVRQAMDVVRRRISVWKGQNRGASVQLFVYFSGHSDGYSLELGNDRLGFSELRAWVRGAGADLRFIIVDSCRSGGLLTTKGGHPGVGFDLPDTGHDSEGEVIITSSAPNEAALESARLGGSFFSHNLISALRGAADHSGDGRVTVEEAYNYAYDRTLSGTAETLYGGQHPGFDLQVSGRGSLVLTRVGAANASLLLPPSFNRYLVTNQDDVVMAETGETGARKFGLRPGRYQVRAWRGKALFRAQVTLGSHTDLILEKAAFISQDLQNATARGTELSIASDPAMRAERSVSPVGWEAALGRGDGWLGGSDGWGVRVGIGPAHGSGFFGSIGGLRAQSPGAPETNFLAAAGYRLAAPIQMGSVSVEPRLSLAIVGALLNGGQPAGNSVATGLSPATGVVFGLGPSIQLLIEGELPLALVTVRADGVWVSPPRLWFGLAWRSAP